MRLVNLCAERGLARHGVRSIVIAPDTFGTPMIFSMPQEVQDALAASVPFPSRLGTQADYARLVQAIVTNVKLTRFRGHLILTEEGVLNANPEVPISGRVSSTDGRTGPSRAQAHAACA